MLQRETACDVIVRGPYLQGKQAFVSLCCDDRKVPHLADDLCDYVFVIHKVYEDCQSSALPVFPEYCNHRNFCMHKNSYPGICELLYTIDFRTAGTVSHAIDAFPYNGPGTSNGARPAGLDRVLHAFACRMSASRRKKGRKTLTFLV